MIFSKTNILLVILIVATLAAIGFAHVKLLSIRSDVAMRQQRIDAAPKEMQETDRLKKELSDAQNKMDSLQKMTVRRDGLPEVVSAIQETAVLAGVSAQVPQVQQNTSKGSPASDPLDDVRFHVSASGTPIALMGFLYRIEQLPYLLHVASWSIDTTHVVALNFFSSVPATSPLPNAPQGSSLEADIVISILK